MIGELLPPFSFQGKKNRHACPVKVFGKNTTRSEAEVWRFFPKPRRGLTFTGQKRHGDTFAQRKEKGGRDVCLMVS
ncbi:MAG: hypothetical protein LBE79_12715 [Tannerella sp.]|jgi:hypothetical protein|nr:hypothetical protein [Tannerella sp.]